MKNNLKENGIMKTLEIWTNTNHESQLIEKWELQPEGNALLSFAKDKEVGPMYKKFGDVTPKEGIRYLDKLKDIIDNSSYMKVKVS